MPENYKLSVVVLGVAAVILVNYYKSAADQSSETYSSILKTANMSIKTVRKLKSKYLKTTSSSDDKKMKTENKITKPKISLNEQDNKANLTAEHRANPPKASSPNSKRADMLATDRLPSKPSKVIQIGKHVVENKLVAESKPEASVQRVHNTEEHPEPENKAEMPKEPEDKSEVPKEPENKAEVPKEPENKAEIPKEQEKKEDPESSRASMLAIAKKISSTQGFVFLLFLNDAYLEMTQNWLCRVAVIAPDVVSGVLFVTTSQGLSDKLIAFNPNVWTFAQDYAENSSVAYGSYAYFRLTEERLIIQNYLIQGGVNVVVIESDATWNSAQIVDVIRERLQNYDIVSTDEINNGRDHESCACLLGVSSNPKSRQFFQSYVDRYAGHLHAHKHNKKEFIGHMGEQKVMTKMLDGSGITISWLNQCESANGKWYRPEIRIVNKDRCPVPLVIQNNWIKGNDEKVNRIKRFGQWYLNKDGSCVSKENMNMKPLNI